MTWTTEKPTEPGWYWYRAREHKMWVAEVIKTHTGLRIHFEWGWQNLESVNRTSEFAGPIPMPEEA